MPRLGFGLPLVSSLQESPITLIEDLLWEDIDTNNNISVNYQETRTNSILRSQDITNAEAWSKTNVAADSTLYEAPDGSDTANAIKSDSTGEKAYNITQANLSVTSGKTYTLSVYLKKQNLDFARIYFSDGTSKTADFNLNTGVVGTTSNTIRTQVDAMDDGWYRCSMTFVATSTVSSGQARFYAQSASGDNTPNVAVSGIVLIYVWGFQLEENSEPSAYIKTTTSSRTTTEVLNDFSNVWDFDGADIMPEADPDSEGAWETLDNLVLNGTYEELGSEKVNYPSDVSSITDPWILDSSTNKYKYVDSGSGTGRINFGTPFAVEVGQIYKVEVDITISSGNANMAFKSGNSQTSLFNNRDFSNGLNTFFTTVSGINGSVARIFVNGNNTDNDFTLNSISVKQVDPNDRWTLGTGWSIEDGKAISTTAQSNLTSTAALVVGNTYEFTLTSAAVSSGSYSFLLRFNSTNTDIGTVNSDGTHTFRAVADSTSFRLQTLSGGGTSFSIDNITVREYAIQPQNV